jgi:acetylxylan esterase
MARTNPLAIGLAALSVLCSVVTGALVQVTDFGANPTGLQMYINVPNKLAAKPAVILAVGFSFR